MWLGVLPLVVRALWTSGWDELVEGARGRWLLAAVGTESVAATAAVFAGDTGARVLLPAVAALWLLGLLLYAVIPTFIVVRAVTRTL